MIYPQFLLQKKGKISMPDQETPSICYYNSSMEDTLTKSRARSVTSSGLKLPGSPRTLPTTYCITYFTLLTTHFSV